MTFNNSCFFTALANLLEDFDIDIEDRDIIKDSYIPYIFSFKDNVYHSGYSIQEADVLNDYLKQYILSFKEKKYTTGSLEERKHNLIKELRKTKYRKIVSLKLYSNEEWHATIFEEFRDSQFHFTNMRRNDDNRLTRISLTYDELFEKLADVVQYGYLERDTKFIVLNKKSIFNNSLSVLNSYMVALKEYVNNSYDIEKRIDSRDKLFKALLLNYLDISSLMCWNELHNDLKILQRQYLDSFKVKDVIRLSDYMDVKLIGKCFLKIKQLIHDNKSIKYYHGSKIKNLKQLHPSVSIHDKEYVYLTTKKEVALMYTVNAIESFYEKNNLDKPKKFHPWYSYGFKNGKLQLEEYYEGAIEETYKGKSGVLYEVEEPMILSNPTNIFCAAVTEEEVGVVKQTEIIDLYELFIQYEKEGIIDINWYHSLTGNVKKHRIDMIKESIQHFSLTQDQNHNYIVFLKAKFPELF